MSIDFGIGDLIGGIHGIYKDAREQRRINAELERRKGLLLAEFEKGRGEGLTWLTLGRLCWSMGLDPANEINRNLTTELLRRLPPPGPARHNRKHYDPPKPPAGELWGLETTIGA